MTDAHAKPFTTRTSRRSIGLGAAAIGISLVGKKSPAWADEEPKLNVAKGEIKDISYFGDISIYHVLLANGRLIRISRPNRSRWDQDNFAAGEEVWVSWGGSSPVVLQS